MKLSQNILFNVILLANCVLSSSVETTKPYLFHGLDSNSTKQVVEVKRHLQHFSVDNPYNPNSTRIRNDVQWRDNNGDLLNVGRGGKITKIDGIYYWVGNKPAGKWSAGGDIYLYKSTHLGSNSWQLVRKVFDFDDGQTAANCEIHVNNMYGTTMIHCKTQKMFISYNGIHGDFEKSWYPDPSDLSNDWNWGSNAVYVEGNNMYFAVSRCKKATGDCKDTRMAYIYKLNDAWTGFDETMSVVTEWNWPDREALEIFKFNSKYYIAASGTAGWRDSRTWFRRASTLEGLSSATDEEVVMHPANNKQIKSMGTQFRFFMKVGQGKWLFAGSRHPDEDPLNFDSKYGRNVMAPVNFKAGVPHVYWKYQFNWQTYDYSSNDFDAHYHGGNGHAGTCSSYHCTLCYDLNTCRDAGCNWEQNLCSSSPTKQPAISPTKYPTQHPTISPTKYPTKKEQSNEPTKYSSMEQTQPPTIQTIPTRSPSKLPTIESTKSGETIPLSMSPTMPPTSSPSQRKKNKHKSSEKADKNHSFETGIVYATNDSSNELHSKKITTTAIVIGSVCSAIAIAGFALVIRRKRGKYMKAGTACNDDDERLNKLFYTSLKESDSHSGIECSYFSP